MDLIVGNKDLVSSIVAKLIKAIIFERIVLIVEIIYNMVAVNPKMVGWMIIVLIVVSFVVTCLAATSLTMAEKKVHAMIISVA